MKSGEEPKNIPDTRKTLLEKILRYETPDELQRTRKSLAEYGWDSDGYIVRLTPEMIISVLDRYLRSELTEKQVEDWAEAIEMREDIEHGIDNEAQIQMTIYTLASPALEGELTKETAQKLIALLKEMPSHDES